MFENYADRWGARNDLFAITHANYEVVKKFLELDADFQSRNKFGLNALGLFCIAPKEVQHKMDIQVLDILYQKDLLGNLNDKIFDFKSKYTKTKKYKIPGPHEMFHNGVEKIII